MFYRQRCVIFVRSRLLSIRRGLQTCISPRCRKQQWSNIKQNDEKLPAIICRTVHYVNTNFTDNWNRRRRTYAAEYITVHVIGSGGNGSAKSIVLNIDDRSQLYNCGEGTGRNVTMSKNDMRKIDHFFVTHCTWKNIGGLFSMFKFMTMIGRDRIVVHGPPGAEIAAGSGRMFGENVGNFKIVKHELTTKRLMDECLNVHYIALLPTEVPESQKHVALKDAVINRFVRGNIIRDRGSIHPHFQKFTRKQRTASIGYIIQPFLGKNGTDKPIFVVECPEKSYLKSLVTGDSWFKYGNPDLIIHFTPRHILQHKTYQKWMKMFPESVNHLILDETLPDVCAHTMYRDQWVRHHIHPSLFPLLANHTKMMDYRPPDAKDNQHFGFAGMKYFYRAPTLKKGLFSSKQCRILVKDEFELDLRFDKKHRDAFEKASALFQCEKKENDAVVYPEIIFTGTGSSFTTKDRNVAGIWVNLSPDCSVMFDCGEDTYGQLCRFHGDKVDEMMGKLKAIFISHLHADHHLGFPQLLEARRSIGITEKLPVVMPGSKQYWLGYLNQVLRIEPLIESVAMEDVMSDGPGAESLRRILGLDELKVVWMDHNMYPFGWVFRHRDGWGLAYSGDSRPSEDFVRAGKGVDLLIHEATFADALWIRAQRKKHSTISEAIEVGQQMDAKFTLLTHFHQKYLKFPPLSNPLPENVGLAYDNMRVHLGNVRDTHRIVPFLQTIYREQIDKHDAITDRVMELDRRACRGGR